MIRLPKYPYPVPQCDMNTDEIPTPRNGTTVAGYAGTQTGNTMIVCERAYLPYRSSTNTHARVLAAQDTDLDTVQIGSVRYG